MIVRIIIFSPANSSALMIDQVLQSNREDYKGGLTAKRREIQENKGEIHGK